MSRRPEVLVAVGAIVLGLALGLSYAWLIDPVDFYNTTPTLLRTDYLHDWIRLAALGYAADGDMQRAINRLDGLEQADIQTALSALIENYAARGEPADRLRLLSTLAERLDVQTPAMAVYLGPLPPSPTPQPATTPLPTTAPSPTPSPSPSPVPIQIVSPNRVISQTVVCSQTTPQLQIVVLEPPPSPETETPASEQDEEDPEELAGVVLWLTWPDGSDRAVTGLRPELGAGYADFELQPGVPYSLSIGEPNAPVISQLMVQYCPANDGEPQPGSWRVIVQADIP